jgi:hypothetical protein
VGVRQCRSKKIESSWEVLHGTGGNLGGSWSYGKLRKATILALHVHYKLMIETKAGSGAGVLSGFGCGDR